MCVTSLFLDFLLTFKKHDNINVDDTFNNIWHQIFLNSCKLYLRVILLILPWAQSWFFKQSLFSVLFHFQHLKGHRE